MRTLKTLWKNPTPYRMELLAFFPALAFLAWFMGDQAMMILFAAVLPVLLALHGAKSERQEDTQAEAIIAQCLKEGKTTYLFRVNPILARSDLEHLRPQDIYALESQVRARLKQHMRAGDLLDMDAYGSISILLSPMRLDSKFSADDFAQRLEAALSYPFSTNSFEVIVDHKVGICQLEAAETPTLIGLQQGASDALKRATNDAVRSFHYRDTPQALQISDNELQNALKNGEIRPYFQPQIDADSLQLTGLEALARWEHPIHGTLPPAQFLPQLQRLGLMHDLTMIHLKPTFEARASVLKAIGQRPLSVCLNICEHDLNAENFVDQLIFAADKYDCPPEEVCLEVLETLSFETESAQALHTLQTLKQAGFKLALDDFGTGPATMKQMAQFTVDTLKIDRSFVTGISKDLQKQRLVTAILALAEQLGLQTVAEGIESAPDMSLMAQLGCKGLQGYYIAKPMPAEDLTAWFFEWRRTHGTPKTIFNRKAS